MGNYSMVIYFVDLLNVENYIGLGMTACASTHQRVRQKNCEQKASLDCITRLFVYQSKGTHERNRDEMAQSLGALANLPEDLGSISRTHKAAHNCP